MKALILDFINHLRNWQSLAGAFIGAFIPIVFSFYLYRHSAKKDYKAGLILLEKILVSSVNDLLELKRELEMFLGRAQTLINNLKSESNKDKYFTSVTNFPIHIIDHDRKLIDTKIGSIYLANKMMICFSVLKDIDASLKDFREEFKDIVQRNHGVILSYKDPKNKIGISPIEQKDMLLSSLEGISKTIKEAIIDQNIPIAIKSLMGARIFLLKLIKHPRWTRIKYEGLFGKNLKKSNWQEIIEMKFNKKLEKELIKIYDDYNKKFPSSSGMTAM